MLVPVKALLALLGHGTLPVTPGEGRPGTPRCWFKVPVERGSLTRGPEVTPPAPSGRCGSEGGDGWGPRNDRRELRTLHAPECPHDRGVHQGGHGCDDYGRQSGLRDEVEDRGQVVQRQQHQDACRAGHR